ncbi:hypothetical protein E2C01_057126 [Portunus trituberculatus]|uniref:Uncharacterized protein n=1 Tax=Portunus trituberculatus TaxID=210409 RepID=A0A5B7H084_PORTR|nr:hypothetical protein [Portunus trituberculatus]
MKTCHGTEGVKSVSALVENPLLMTLQIPKAGSTSGAQAEVPNNSKSGKHNDCQRRLWRHGINCAIYKELIPSSLTVLLAAGGEREREGGRSGKKVRFRIM